MSAAAFKEATAAPATALRQRKAGRVNYIIESSTPAMLCLVRGAQSKSYTPLTPEDLYEAVQPHDLSLRPSPYIAHQSLIDFYRICDGYYGVESDEVDLHQLTVSSHSKNHSSSSSNNNSSGGVGGISSSSSATLPAPSFSAAATAAAASTVQAPPPLPSPDDPNIAVKLNDYRIAQLRRNAVHIDNKVFHGGASAAGASASASSASSSSATASTGGAGVCHFYRTPVGCHRGAACPFLHLEKTGSSASRSPFGTGKK